MKESIVSSLVQTTSFCIQKMGHPSEGPRQPTIKCYNWEGKEVALPPGANPYERCSKGSYYILNRNGTYNYMCGADDDHHRGDGNN